MRKRNRKRKQIIKRKRQQMKFIYDAFAVLVILFLSMILLSTSVTYFTIMLRFLIKFLLFFAGFLGCIYLIYWAIKWGR